MSDRQEIRDLYEPEKSLSWFNPKDWDDYAKTGIARQLWNGNIR